MSEEEQVFDSTTKTLEHISLVRTLLLRVRTDLMQRGMRHDRSKLHDPEKPYFDANYKAMATIEYGTPAYQEAIAALGPALDHHYAENSHHPQHYPNGLAGMNLLDIVEMLADWKAASSQYANGSLEASIKHNIGRFGIEPQLAQILENTRIELGW